MWLSSEFQIECDVKVAVDCGSCGMKLILLEHLDGKCNNTNIKCGIYVKNEKPVSQGTS